MATYDRPLGYVQVTAGGVNAAATLASLAGGSIPAGASKVLITPSAQAIRYRDDGTNPTATVGMPVAVGVQLVYTGSLAALVIIAQVAGAALDMVFYG